MTKIILAALAALTLGAAPAFAQDHEGMNHGDHAHDHAETAVEAETDAAPLAAAEGRTVTAKVRGMVCDFCARSLTKVLKRDERVEDVAIDLTDKTVTIVLAEGASMTDEEVEKAVLSAGYNLDSVARS